MKALWKKVTMIMLMGLLIAGPLGRLPHAAADNSALGLAHTALGAAEAAEAQAEKQYQQTMSHMDSMKKMSMSANEKAMMDQMAQMAATIKSLMETNQQLIETVKQLIKDRENK
jgi:phosphoserine phosphatase